MATPTTGYIHGSDLLLGIMVNEVFTPLGHSKTCKIQNKAETKDRATKETSQSGKWTDKKVNKLNVSISADGFAFYGDTLGYSELLAMWEAGEAVVVKYAHRGEEATKYRSGSFLITDLSEDAPADDDATYSISLENSGEVKTFNVAG
jgi:predicted secreted protein